jgi:FixJ family two-component response regulator
MKEERPIVYLIDDDESVREGIADLLRSVGHDARTFGSVQQFIDSSRSDAPGCIVLDVRLPGMSGLEFQRSLIKSNIDIPLIFISAHADVPMTVRAIKLGAVDFLTKPVHEQQLLDTVQAAIERDRARRKEAKVVAELRERFDSLTPREREIFTLMISGRRNKQIAAQAGLSEMTVKVHRSHVMQKMQANSVVELVRIADQLGVSTTAS